LYTHGNPEKVISLGLLDNAGVTAPVQSEHQRELLQGKNRLIVRSVEDFDALLSFAASKKPFIPWPVKGVFAQRATDRRDINQSIFDSYQGDRSAGLEPILNEIINPVLILWGENDRILDISSVQVMRPLLPHAEVIIMQDTGHIPMIERPSETAAHFLGFLEQI
jgi:pimeloyl-ACP methyl ester carboxylesterase